MDDMIGSDEDNQARGEVARWVKEIELYDREFGPWVERVKKIVSRYKDERLRIGDVKKGKYNILWSNLQTLIPAIYSQNPNPNVDRRNTTTEDEVATKASEVVERSLSYYVKEDDFFDIMEQCCIDRLLGGRATAAVRYVPEFGEEVEITNDPNATSMPQLKSEKIEVDYTNWLDFGHTWGRTWDEVRATWKRAYLTREEGIKRFGEIFKTVPLDHSPEKLNDEKIDEGMKKACIYEIWDKESKSVIWISKSFPLPLDAKPDPLHLNNFFPWPKPLYATLANDNLIPTPDYVEYQDQAQELDELTARIKYITKAIKVAGLYDSSAPGIERLLVEGNENILIPVANWAIFGEKGGLAGAMNLLPMKDISQTLLTLYEARDKVKMDLNEISGLSDIVRGQGDPNETAAGVQTKSSFATLRLDRTQKQMQRFVRDTLRIMAQMICGQFSLETLKDISGVMLPMAQEKMQFQQQQMMAQQPPQPGMQPPPPVDPKTVEFMSLPTWEDVYGFLQNDKLRSFRIDIETDSTIKQDQEAERVARMDFLKSAGGYIQEMAQVQNPVLMPLLGEMLRFGVRGFKVAKDLENCFDLTIDKLEKEAENPTPKPDPETMKIQAQAQQHQAELQQTAQIEQMKQQNQAQIENQRNQLENERENNRQQMEAQLEVLKAQHEKELEAMKIQGDQAMEKYKTDQDNETKIIVAKIAASTQLRTASMSADPAKKSNVGPDDIDENGEPLERETTLDDLVNVISNNLSQVFDAHAQLQGQVQMLAQQMTAPKKVVRGPDGKISGVVVDNGVMN